MRDSDTYLAILDEGQVKHAKKTVLLVGETRLGPADESVKARLAEVTDLERLDRMLLQAITAATW
jgi:hypothetical protein